MATNVLFAAVSVPLALHYLRNETFALWALIGQLTGYIALFDLGMTASIGRLLADHKDDRDGGAYGSILQTGLLAFCIQAFAVAGASLALAPWAAQWFGIAAPQQRDFVFVLVGTGLMLALSFLGKTVTIPFWTFQRYDVMNYAGSAGMLVNLAVTWLSFRAGWGLRSLLAGSAAMTALTLTWSAIACVRLGFLPARGAWGRVDRQRLAVVLPFARDVFLMNLGTQMLWASQVIVVSRTLGLDAAAAWAVCTKFFVLAQQFVCRLYDHSVGAFTEMIVRGELDRLRLRFKGLVSLTGSLAVAVGMLGVASNGGFVRVWTSGRVAWPTACDALMAAGLAVFAVARCHTGLVGLTKRLEVLRYIFFLEGATFLLLAWPLAHSLGLTGIATATLLATLGWSTVFGVTRTRTYFHCGTGEVIAWLRPAFALALGMVPVVALAWWAASRLTGVPHLLVTASISGCGCAVLFWFVGLSKDLRDELLRFLQKARG